MPGELAGQTLGGRYLVGVPLARGGMATVYLATDLRLQRTVAIKVLRPDLSADPDFMARFIREARATAALAHPNVVSVFDFDAGDDLAYLVLEYVPGRTLRHLLNDSRLTPAQALAVTAQILEALSAAHDAAIMHRDIKPENVLIGPRGTIKVADFGLARAMDDHEHTTRTGMIIGTPAYVSPEHVSGTGTSTQSDLYSTGVLLFEMLTGSVPFVGESAFSVAFQHLNSDVPRPSTRAAGIPTELDELVLGATARDPVDRFPTAHSFLDEVHRAQALMPRAEPLPQPEPTAGETVILDGVADSDGSATVGLVDPADDALPTPAGVSPEQRRARPLVVLLLFLLLVGGLSWAFFAGPLQRGTVPDVAGLSVPDAEATLDGSGMRLTVSSSEYSETAPLDTVIRQDPAAGSGAFLRLPVSVVTSLGPERYDVPDVRGRTVAEATDAITGTKLSVAGQAAAFDEEIEAGLVVGTDPPAGTVSKPQAPVTLVVSQGPPPRPVPDVLGKPAAEAQAALEGAGLAVQQREEFSDRFAAGTIASVDPAVGTEVAKGSTVAVVVSKGPPPVQVPRVVDLKRSDAIARLEGAGFQVQVQAGIVTPLDRVYSQDPPPGELRPRGSTVTISIF